MTDESDKVKDLLRWWMHTWESRDLILNQCTAITSPNPDTHGFSMDAMKSAIPDTVGKLEALRHESIDKYEWPTFTNSKANSLVVEIKQKAENIFALHLEMLRLVRAHFFPEVYPDTVNDVDRQLRDFVNNNNKLTNYVIQESKQGDRKLHELMQLYRINISEQESHTVMDHSHDMQKISASEKLPIKRTVGSSYYWRRLSGNIIPMVICIAIVVTCAIFLHLDFFASILWWCFFFLSGLIGFLVFFTGVMGHPTRSLFTKIVMVTIAILSLIFFWWQGGLALIISFIIWTFFFSMLRAATDFAKTTTPSYDPNDRLKH